MTNPESRILVCAPSNGVADEIALRLLKCLAETGDHSIVLRLYAGSQKRKNIDGKLRRISYFSDRRAKMVEKICKHRVVLSTLAISGKIAEAPIGPDHFTHLFIDESESSGETLMLIPIAGILKYIWCYLFKFIYYILPFILTLQKRCMQFLRENKCTCNYVRRHKTIRTNCYIGYGKGTWIWLNILFFFLKDL